MAIIAEGLAVIVFEMLVFLVPLILALCVWLLTMLYEAAVWLYDHVILPGLQAVGRQLQAWWDEWQKPNRLRERQAVARREMQDRTDQFIAEIDKMFK